MSNSNALCYICPCDRLLTVIPFFFVFFSCNFAQNYPKDTSALGLEQETLVDDRDSMDKFEHLDTLQTGLNFRCGANYDFTKSEMVNLRTRLKTRLNAIAQPDQKSKVIDSIAAVFTTKLLNDIIPYWYGTEWDFEGHTSIPKNGQIACGYFVSTTLKDMGLKMNRYRFAQADPSTEAKSYAIIADNMQEFVLEDFRGLSEVLNRLDIGLYFVGLDNHVGYFYKNAAKNYFIHSNYVEGKVMIEIAEKSPAFSSSSYCFAKISTNRALALKWVMGSRLVIAD